MECYNKNNSSLPPPGVLLAFLPPLLRSSIYRHRIAALPPTTAPYHRTTPEPARKRTNLRYTNSLKSLKPNPSVPT